MLTELFLALIQAATEFLPVSSSGHLALVSNLISEPNLFFFTVLHLASLIAVLIFTRKEIAKLLSFDRQARRLWRFLIIATIPAAAVGYFFNEVIEAAFTSYLFLAVAFSFTGVILFLTKYTGATRSLQARSALFIGLFQIFALFPGVSRSGMTISAARFLGIEKEQAARFSFLLLIPLALGAVVLESGDAYFSAALVASFFLCLLASLLFLHLLMTVIRRGKFWLFSFYCFALAAVSLALHFFG